MKATLFRPPSVTFNAPHVSGLRSCIYAPVITTKYVFVMANETKNNTPSTHKEVKEEKRQGAGAPLCAFYCLILSTIIKASKEPVTVAFDAF